MSTLELNIKAKRHVPEAPKPHPGPVAGPLVLKAGTRYITRDCKRVVELLKQVEGGLWLSVDGYYFTSDGGFSPMGPDYPRSLAREWFPTWKEHDAWVAGKEVKADCYVYLYKTICGDFGTESQTTKEWWHKHYANRNPVIFGA